jgi:hypothetical protein
MSKSTNRRKSIAIALAVLGVAGLSLASAAQLNLTGGASVQSGVTPVINQDCQTKDINVKFSDPVRAAGSSVYSSASVIVSGIETSCGGHKYKLVALDGNNAPVVVEASSTLPTTPIDLTINLAAGLDNTVKTVALTIYS